MKAEGPPPSSSSSAAPGIEQLLGKAPETTLTLPQAPYRAVAAHKGMSRCAHRLCVCVCVACAWVSI